jgi:hypothetical protein
LIVAAVFVLAFGILPSTSLDVAAAAGLSHG